MDSLARLRAELLAERYGPTRARPDETPEDSPTQIAEVHNAGRPEGGEPA